MEKQKKCRAWLAVLYPEENMEHKLIVYRIQYESKNNFKFLMIDHKGEKKDDDSTGKDHTHVLIKFENQQFKKPLMDLLQVSEENRHLFIPCKSVNGYLKYMVHYGYLDKIQYSPDDVYGDENMKAKLKKVINADEVEEIRVCKITNFIDNSGRITVRDVYDYCVTNGLYSDYRRAYVLFSEIIKQHNTDVILKERSKNNGKNGSWDDD